MKKILILLAALLYIFAAEAQTKISQDSIESIQGQKVGRLRPVVSNGFYQKSSEGGDSYNQVLDTETGVPIESIITGQEALDSLSADIGRTVYGQPLYIKSGICGSDNRIIEGDSIYSDIALTGKYIKAFKDGKAIPDSLMVLSGYSLEFPDTFISGSQYDIYAYNYNQFDDLIEMDIQANTDADSGRFTGTYSGFGTYLCTLEIVDNTLHVTGTGSFANASSYEQNSNIRENTTYNISCDVNNVSGTNCNIQVISYPSNIQIYASSGISIGVSTTVNGLLTIPDGDTQINIRLAVSVGEAYFDNLKIWY